MDKSLLLNIEGLDISFPSIGDKSRVRVVNSFSMTLHPGERIGIVGESGSGKTMIGRAILGLLPSGGRIDRGRINFYGSDLTSFPSRSLRELRGKQIGMIFQEPMVSLNPALTIGQQMAEGVMLHTGCSRRDADRQSVVMLQKVNMDRPESVLKAYPHAFSGGMRQRIMLASVLLMKPNLLIADEPTTALDAVVEKDVLELMMELVRDSGTSLILISHDLRLMAQHMDQIIVMRRGDTMETGKASDVIAKPQSDYTKSLIDALPARGRYRVIDKTKEPVVEASNVSVVFHGNRPWPWTKPSMTTAVDNVSVNVYPGEIVGLVGESGSGKTTLGRAVLNLVPAYAGKICINGSAHGSNDSDFRRHAQIIFQDPNSSLDPRMTVRQIVSEGLRHAKDMTAADKEIRVNTILNTVQMPHGTFADRYPHELSGGQRQRICIARAVVTRPRFVVADEPVSALDLKVQREVLSLIKNLQEQMGFSSLFITHDIGVVEEIADRIIVMYQGRIVEMAPRASFFSSPTHPYSRRLLSAAPTFGFDASGARVLQERTTPATNAPQGYRFAERFDVRGDLAYIHIAPEHFIAVVRSN